MKICKKNHKYSKALKRCPECKKIWNREWRRKNPVEALTYMRKYYETNKDKFQEYGKTRYDANKEQIKANSKRWQNENPEKTKKSRKKWRKQNLAKCGALAAKRRSSELKATPPWLTNEHFLEIEQFYIDAKELQWLSDPTDPFEIDHIIPLQGKNVCGLHVPWNLQIIPTSKNRSKSNKY